MGAASSAEAEVDILCSLGVGSAPYCHFAPGFAVAGEDLCELGLFANCWPLPVEEIDRRGDNDCEAAQKCGRPFEMQRRSHVLVHFKTCKNVV